MPQSCPTSSSTLDEVDKQQRTIVITFTSTLMADAFEHPPESNDAIGTIVPGTHIQLHANWNSDLVRDSSQASRAAQIPSSRTVNPVLAALQGVALLKSEEAVEAQQSRTEASYVQSTPVSFCASVSQLAK